VRFSLTKDNLIGSSKFLGFFPIEFKLPAGMSYCAGDYLAILPTNPKASVKRVLKYFKLSEEVTNNQFIYMKLNIDS
jgi:sulfite reductase alpha subunit-like flavoprotein